MKLNLQTIQEITLGAVRVTEESEGICFYRFTEQQEELYRNRSEALYKKTFATSGVKFSFRTNSRKMGMKVSLIKGSSRTYFSYDVWVDGKMVDSLNNFEGVELPDDYTVVSLERGDHEKEFALGEGEKLVEVYFPWSSGTILREFTLDDGATVEPVKPKHKLLCFGDSITQGYDALHPSQKYTTQLARYLDAEEINKGIGAEFFFPALVLEKESFVPDYVTVAYGTNDWSHHTREKFVSNCKAFFENAVKTYPNSKIIAITPIWRKDTVKERPFGAFEDVDGVIREIVKDMNITVVTGYDFVEHRENLYADLKLHPNDEGFCQYFTSLSQALKNEI